MLKTFAEFKELAAAPRPEFEKPGGDEGDGAGGGGGDGGGGPGKKAKVKSSTTLPLKPFLAEHKLKGNKEKVAAVLAWSAESGEKQKLTFDELEALWKRGGFKMPANFPRDVRKAQSEGWIDSEGKGPTEVFLINGYGEDIVAGWLKEE